VQAPSTYGNLDNWVARGAAEQELVLQGPLQRGFYGHSETPFIIGSHCTYRMSAIREIGGFQPTRAEDHLDTLMLAARAIEACMFEADRDRTWA
jgi:cellulose synthase (UDP-forming)